MVEKSYGIRVTLPTKTTSAFRAAVDDGMVPRQPHAAAKVGRHKLASTTSVATDAVRALTVRVNDRIAPGSDGQVETTRIAGLGSMHIRRREPATWP